MRFSLLMTLVLILSSCTHKNPQDPSSLRTPQNTEEFLSGIALITADLNDPGRFNANTCGSYLEEKTEYLFTRPFNYYNPKTPQEIELFAKKSQESINNIFKIRLALREKIKEFHANKTLTPECIAGTRRALMVARSAEDLVMLWLRQKNLIGKESVLTFAGNAPHTLKNPKFFSSPNQAVELKTGDLIMMRGTSVVSALIGRIGDEEGMFSHVGMVYIDATTKKGYILESLIETGYVTTSLTEWMKSPHSRAAIYRYPDATLAAKAAKSLYDHVNSFKKARGKTVPYDFAMNMNSYDKLFCAEVVRLAYDKATDGKIILPTFQTSFAQAKQTGFLKQMGIGAVSTFSPNDLDIEPRFDLVAEYRNIQNAPKLRLQDATMESMFDWMERYNYELQFSLKDQLVGFGAKFMHELGLDENAVPDGMSRPVIMTMIKLKRLQEDILFKHISEYEAQFLKDKGLYPSYQDLLRELDRFRLADCQAYKKEKGPQVRALFHQFFRSNSASCPVAN